MCARFSVFVIGHAVFAYCVTVNVINGSQIIADTKEELSPIIIDSKLNQVITIYVPVIKGEKANYYLTDPRGKERKLNIKQQERKKRKSTAKKYGNSTVSHSFDIMVKSSNSITDKQIKIDRKLSLISNELAKTYKDIAINLIYNVKQTQEANINLNLVTSKNENYDNSLTNYYIVNQKEKKIKWKEDYKRCVPDKNIIQQTESQPNTSTYHTSKLKTAKQKEELPNINVINFLEGSNSLKDNDAEKIILHAVILKEAKSNQSMKYSEITKVENGKTEQNLSDVETNKDVKMFLNEVVEVSDLSDYDDEVFKNKRRSNLNFNIGPLTEDDHGNWVLSVFYKNKSSWVELYQVITIHIFESIPAQPKAIRLHQGSDYVLSFSYPIDHLQSCQLVSPRAATEKYYERYGTRPEYCGYIVKNVSKTEEGAWCIVGVGKIVYEAHSYLQVGTGYFNFSNIKQFEDILI